MTLLRGMGSRNQREEPGESRFDRQLVLLIMVAAAALSVVGMVGLMESSRLIDYYWPARGIVISLWAASMIIRKRPRPVWLVAAGLMSQVGLAGIAAVTQDPSLISLGPAVAVGFTGGIVAMAATRQHRPPWYLWAAIVSVTVLLVRIAGEGGPREVALDTGVATVAALAAMYVVSISRTLIRSTEHQYQLLADSTSLAVAEVDCAPAVRALDELNITTGNLEAALADRPTRNRVIDGMRVARISFGQLVFLEDQSVSGARDLLQRMLRAPRHRELLVRSVESLLTGQSFEYQSSDRGRHVLIKWSRHPDDHTVLTGITMDMTAQKRAELALEDEVRSKDQFIASVSHELRTPLTAVLGLAEELRGSNVDIDRAERKELLDIIADQTRDISAIVEDLLVAARAQIGEIAVSRSEIDLVMLTGQSLESINCDVSSEFPAALPALGDAARVKQILRNLLTNALRHGEQPVRVVGGLANGNPYVEVRDKGTPLRDNEVAEIFKPYRRAAGGAATSPESVGLGLSVSRTLADLMDGELRYEHDGSESIFRLSLPKA